MGIGLGLMLAVCAIATEIPAEPKLSISTDRNYFVSTGLVTTVDARLVPPVETPVTITWEVVEPVGSESVQTTGLDENKLQVIFLVPGVYHLRATATDGTGLNISAEKEFVAGTSGVGNFQGALTSFDQRFGRLYFTVGRTGALSGKIRVAGLEIPFSGRLREGKFEKVWDLGYYGDLKLEILRSEDGTRFTGALSVGLDYYFTFSADQSLNAFLASADLTVPFGGKYTFVVQAKNMFSFDPDRDVPHGEGFGLMSISPNGAVRIRGVLPDGSRFSRASQLNFKAEIPIWFSLYHVPYSFSGSISVKDDEIVGWASWRRPAARPGRFIRGFDANVTLRAHAYRVPLKTEDALRLQTDSGAGTLELSSPEWSANDQYPFLFGPKQSPQLTAAGAPSFVLNPKTGLFSGRFLDWRTGNRRTFQGVILQNQQPAGVGLFLTETQTGRVELQVNP